MRNAYTLKCNRFDIVPYLFVAPALLILATFIILPVVMAVRYSFFNFNMLRPDRISFIGADNYKNIITDDLFLTSIGNTFRYAVILVPIEVVVAFGLALLVNNSLKGISIFRIAYFSPMLTSMTVVSILWTFIYNPTPGQGLLNTFLAKLGMDSCPFLRSADTALNSIVAMSVWQSAGNYMMIFLAGLQGVSQELYEAADIDGAGWWRKMRSITIPGLHNVFVFIILMTTISAMKMFTQSFVMTQGGPDNSTMTIVYYVYQQGLQFRNIGYASAASVIFFFIVLILSSGIKKFVDSER